MHHKKKYNEKARVTQWGKEHIPHTSYLLPHTLGRYVHIHVHHTPHTTQIPYLTLPYLYNNIKHLTTAPSSSLDGTTTPTTPTVLGISQYKPPYLPTHPPTLSAKGARGESSIKSFYKSGRHQSQFHSLASTINRPAPVNLGVQYTLMYLDKVP